MSFFFPFFWFEQSKNPKRVEDVFIFSLISFLSVDYPQLFFSLSYLIYILVRFRVFDRNLNHFQNRFIVCALLHVSSVEVVV